MHLLFLILLLVVVVTESINQIIFIFIFSFQGLTDENPSVVKAALNCVEIMLPVLLKDSSVFLSGTELTSKSIPSKSLSYQLTDGPSVPVSLYDFMKSILNIPSNYWLVKIKLSEVLAKLDFNTMNENLGMENGTLFKQMCLDMLLHFLQDEDIRVRNSSSKSICEFLCTQKMTRDNKDQILREFVTKKIFNSLPEPMCRIFDNPIDGNFVSDDLASILFTLSNNLLTVGDKINLYGTISCLKLLIVEFHPIHYYGLWEEFAFLSVFMAFLEEYSLVLFDITNHTDVLEICNHLLSGKAVNSIIDSLELNFIFHHVLKLLNIYFHIFTNQVPLQNDNMPKTELFINEKDLQRLAHMGHFGNSETYMKLYKILQNIHEAYKIDVDSSVADKLLNLLRMSMKTLCLCLELNPINSISQTTKLIEELMSYCMVLVNWEPKLAIKCVHHMFKYFFEQSFYFQKGSFETFYKNSTLSNSEVVAKVAEFNQMKQGQFYHEEIGLLKLFEPMVINSLKVRS